ncbi:hypothetical protein ACFFJ4_03420 [Xanthomonas dyei]|uniref:hypothetical protein n=1 Tax=Xanthomonas dyei TaxID=743699 RepID=UPI0011B0E81D|nr:hypothetical protein [Xanthomonas dyei]
MSIHLSSKIRSVASVKKRRGYPPHPLTFHPLTASDDADLEDFDIHPKQYSDTAICWPEGIEANSPAGSRP